MTIFDQTSNDLKSSRLVLHKLGETFNDFQLRSFSIASLCEQWRTLQGTFAKVYNSLEKRVKEVEAKEREIDEAKNMLRNLQTEVELRQKKLLLDEKSLRESLELEKMVIGDRRKAVEAREKAVSERGEALDAKENRIKEREEALELKLKELKEKEKQKQINVQLEAMQTKEKQIVRSSSLKPQQVKSTRNVARRATYLYSSFLEDDCFSLINMCLGMEANGLRLHIKSRINLINDMHPSSSKWKTIVHNAVYSAPNMRKLVLDVCQNFHDQFPTIRQTVAKKIGCIFLLEIIMTSQEPIPSDVKVEAAKLASSLNPKLNGFNTHLDTFGFLQFLVAFKLADLYSVDELLSIFNTFYVGGPYDVYRLEEQSMLHGSIPSYVYRMKEQSRLCSLLGLSTKIPEVIKGLIEEKKCFIAVKYICVFKLEKEFPPWPLLQDCMKAVKERLNEKYNYGTLESKIQAETMELDTLQEFVECATTFNLVLNFPLNCVVSRVEELKREKKKRQASSSISMEHLAKRPRV